MKLTIVIMALLLVSAVGIGSAVNRLPATEFAGPVDMGGNNITDIGNPIGGYAIKVYIEDSNVIAQWANGTIEYYGDAATQSREAIQAAIYAAEGKTVLLCDAFTVDDNTSIYLNSTTADERVIATLEGLGSSTGIYGSTGTAPLLYAFDANGDPRAGTDILFNSIKIKNMDLKVNGAKTIIKLENLGNNCERTEISGCSFRNIDTVPSGTMIHLIASGMLSINNNEFCSTVDPRFDNNNTLCGVKVTCTAEQYFITGVRITENQFSFMETAISVTGINASKIVYCCGFNIVDNIIVGSDYGIHMTYVDSPIVMGNVIDNNNISMRFADCHGMQIIGNQLGNNYRNYGDGSQIHRGNLVIYNGELSYLESGAIISGNRFMSYNSDVLDTDKHAQILIYIASGHFDKILISDNEIRCRNDAGIYLYGTAAGPLNHTMVVNNIISNFAGGTGSSMRISGDTYSSVIQNNQFFATAIVGGGNDIFKNNVGYVTENSGSSTGTGAKQTIAHGLVSAPSRVSVTPTETGATATWWADATNIYPTVTNGKTFNWAASTW